MVEKPLKYYLLQQYGLMESVDKVCLTDTTLIRWGTYKYNNTQLSLSVQKTPHKLCNTYSSSIMQLIPAHLGQHCFHADAGQIIIPFAISKEASSKDYMYACVQLTQPVYPTARVAAQWQKNGSNVWYYSMTSSSLQA